MPRRAKEAYHVDSPPTFSIALQNCEGMVRPVTSVRWGADEPDHHHITNSCVPIENLQNAARLAAPVVYLC